MTSRQLRLLRGAAASSAATIIAAVSHTIGGGAAPHPLLVVGLVVFLTPLAALLVGRRLRLPRLSAAVMFAQSVFHVLFVVLNATAAGPIAGAAHGHHHLVVLAPVASGVAPDAGMLGAHLVAAVLTIALLWRGEAIVRAIAAWVRAVLRRRSPVPPRRPMPAPIALTSRSVVRTVPVACISRRGPPILSRG